ncbi:TRP-domain-containing protein [Cryphonectria parasitica EP155]|uniref:TRP-domain-containing protein n=1 Tax=Cryphonectria parasitica (strain ATCC 38755 / EP155) TaxID=660469 RepID=A0A9P5CV33_CRYP1|nr:TRP-domain-containing protein [Cryphonectria parasitica EP155]KAF3771077.1 TRP-domain-containing protein [Cryphonectria parasitica EP155]
MRFPKAQGLPLVLLSFASIITSAAAEYVLYTTSLSTCQADSGFSASLFDVVYTPGNNSMSVDMTASSTVSGNVLFDFEITAYGFQIMRKTIDPCTAGEEFAGFCPMSPGNLNNPFTLPVDPSAKSVIPSIAYTFPDIDAKVKVFINNTDGSPVACVSASVSNGKTVDLVAVKWVTAIVAGLALASSALMSGLGHQNAAAHVAANALALCSYFQSQAIVGLVATPLPPSVAAWTQDLSWSLGIIRVQFMQDIFTWYQRSTGGTAANIFDSLNQVSVQVQKRSMAALAGPTQNTGLFRRAAAMAPKADKALLKSGLFRRAVAMMPRVDTVAGHVSSLAKRSGNIKSSSGDYVVTGIQRYAYQANIETTNFFMTGLIWYCIFLVLSALAVVTFKYICEGGVRAGWMGSETFVEFRRDWRTHLKGILFRISLVGFLPLSVLCLWELTQGDSPAEMVLAVGFFLGLIVSLAWASWNVFRMARRSIALHKNPAYALYSDQHALNKWGFLYIQFRASAYYFIIPVLFHTLLKAMFIAFGQGSGVTQAVALIILEVAALIATSVLRPYMDKSTNAINVTICVVNFLNAVFLLIFTDVFDGPGLMIGIVGILLWILNAAVSLILLLILIITTVVIFFKSNPDNRYQMADDRTSFMKSGSVLNTTQQLDALAAAARGDHGDGGYVKAPLEDEDDEDSIVPLGSSTANLPGHRGIAVGRRSDRNSGTSDEMNEKMRPSSVPSTNGSSASMRMDPSRVPVPVSPLASSSGSPSSASSGVTGHRAANNAR